MSYTALYRKYRPDTFEEVKGQDHVVTTLRNQIRANRTSHAYLFCGSRGTGKTSVAKIFAKAVNCEHPADGSPCGECPSCRRIAEGASLNVIEIDAASNNGVDNIRQIREEVAYSPTEGLRKVYIIDEVHMLSAGAFNALLKTLEEPPAYVIFILATTEANKIPVTILSRCQRYDFHRISQEEITLRLKDLLAREQIEADEKAIRYIARKAEGGMRDALSLTDQCISFYMGQKLTYEKVLDVLGAVDTEELGRLFRAISARDVASVFSMLDRMIFRGREITALVSDMTEYLRDLLLIRTTADAKEILDLPAESMQLLQEEANLASEAELMRDIRIFSELSGQIRFSSSRRVLVEVALIKLCRPQMETDVQSLHVRIQQLEKALEQGIAAVPAANAAALQNASQPVAGTSAEQTNPIRNYTKAAPEELKMIDEQWAGILEPLRQEEPLFYRSIKDARRKFDASSDEDILYVIGKGVLTADLSGQKEQITRLEDIIEERIGKRIRVRVMDERTEEESGGSRLQDIRRTFADRIGMPVEIVSD